MYCMECMPQFTGASSSCLLSVGYLSQNTACNRPLLRRSARCTQLREEQYLRYSASRNRHCATCFQTRPEREFSRELLEPFHYRRECAACQFGAPLKVARAGVKETDVIRKQKEQAHRLEMEFRASRQARFENAMARLDECANLARDDAALATATDLRNPHFFEQRMTAIQKLLNLGRGDTITLIREQRDLLLLSPELLAERLLRLRMAVPQADVYALIQHGPWLLLLEDVEGQLAPVLRQLQSIMPSFDVAAKLHEGSGVWWSAADMMRSNGRKYKLELVYSVGAAEVLQALSRSPKDQQLSQ